METCHYRKLFLGAFSLFSFFHYPHCICTEDNVIEQPSLAQEPVSSQGQELANPPTPESSAPLSSALFPLSRSDLPLESTSNPRFKAFQPSNFDSKAESDINPSVKKICESTDYPLLCVATVIPFFNGKSDVISVIEVTLKTTKELARIAFVLVTKFINAPGTPPKIRTILNDCKDSYKDALYNFENTQNAVAARDIGMMNTMLSAVITDVGNCDDEFSKSGSPFPMSRYADKLTNMTSNCLAIVSLIN